MPEKNGRPHRICIRILNFNYYENNKNSSLTSEKILEWKIKIHSVAAPPNGTTFSTKETNFTQMPFLNAFIVLHMLKKLY